MQSEKIKSFLMAFMILMLSSCTSFFSTDVVRYDSFPKEVTLEADSVSTQRVYDNLFVTLNDDKLVVSSFKTDTMMHFYSIPDLKYEFSAGAKGHARDEMQSFPTFCRSQSPALYVRGYTYHTIKKLSILENTLKEEKNFELFLTDVPNDMYMLGDSLLFYNDLLHNEVKCYSISQKEDCMSLKLPDICGTVCNNEVLLGTLCMDDSLAAYAFQYRHEIVLLGTKDLSYKKTIRWDYENQDNVIGNNEKSPCLYYTDGYVTPNGFYFLCRNGKGKDKNAHYCVEVYDKSFTPVYKYKLDRKIYKFVIDEKNRCMYGFGVDDDFIYRYKL